MTEEFRKDESLVHFLPKTSPSFGGRTLVRLQNNKEKWIAFIGR